MIAFTNEVVVPCLLVTLMFVLGTSLKADNFRTIAVNKTTIALTTVAQLALVPLTALMITSGLNLDSELAAAVLVLSLCPGGAISNYYVYLARGDVALSITLTAVSTVLAVVTVPTLVYFAFGPDIMGFDTADQAGLSRSLRVLVLVFLPIAVGMAARHFIGNSVERLSLHLRWTSLALIVLAVILAATAILRESPEVFLAVAPAAMIFTIGTWLTARLAAIFVAAPLRRTITIELSVKNVAIAVAIGMQFVSAEILVAYLLCYFIFEFLLLIAYAYWPHRGKTALRER